MLLKARVLLLFAVVAIKGCRGGGGWSLPPPPASPNSIESEQRVAWRVIRTSCAGCWSGGLRVYLARRTRCPWFFLPWRPKQSSPVRLALRRQKEDRNFRLRVDVNNADPSEQSRGTWTVWNLLRTGDQFVIPIFEAYFNSSSANQQIKIGFDSGIILRLPQRWDTAPRPVLEIGFWDPNGDGMRRTAVFEYQGPGRRKRRLLDVSVIQQMKQKSAETFVGNVTDQSAIAVLPLEAPFDIHDVVKSEDYLTLAGFESVSFDWDGEKMGVQRESRSGGDGDDAAEAKRILSLLLQNDPRRARRRLAGVLPCGMCFSVPVELRVLDPKNGGAGSVVDAVFAHQWHSPTERGCSFEAVHVKYCQSTRKVERVTLYSYRPR